MGRIILLLTIGIVIGLIVGLVYTWVIDPGNGADVSPNSLRAEYKEEYVVMIAQAYTTNSNLETARTQLATLKLVNPDQFLADLVDKKTKQGSSPDELQALLAFAQALSGSAGSTP